MAFILLFEKTKVALEVFVSVMDCIHGSVGSQGGTDVGGLIRQGVALEAPRCLAFHWYVENTSP